ncbi:hypothetical protein DWB77_02174 [Streptomyces hundungensis]|uniref:DUF304 domain-containing protein n=1 Tax=Streptomyces hundungensis TaxID=1077946 RepID=A0A387HGL2_9ACTN|nr:hypothetical protein [Streptomyces hundungensis]AYG80050.1 hypothetical protein DWB77_02174 [Streptomyces hundungensis]
MPLPFLTADRAVDAPGEYSDDVALPFDDRDRWRRPYRPGPWRVGAAALLLLLASFVLLAAVVIAAAGAPAAAIVVLGVAVLVIASALRLLRVGVWVSRAGLRRVAFFTTTTVSWPRVRGVRTVQQPVRWLGLPRTVQGQALLAERQDGETLPPLLTDHNADFLGRAEAFDRAADLLEAWGDEYRAG